MPSTTSARLLLLASCLLFLPPLTSTQCSSFVPTSVGTSGLYPYNSLNSTNITISYAVTCPGPSGVSDSRCWIDGGSTYGQHSNDTIIKLSIGGPVTDNATLAFPASTSGNSTADKSTSDKSSAPFIINRNLPADVQASLLALVGAAENFTITPSITTKQSSGYGSELQAGESGYFVFQPYHECIQGVFQGCSGAGYQNGPVEVCWPLSNPPQTCNGQDCIEGRVSFFNVPTNETAEVSCWPCVQAGKSSAEAATSAAADVRGMSGVVLGVAMAMSLVVALFG